MAARPTLTSAVGAARDLPVWRGHFAEVNRAKVSLPPTIRTISSSSPALIGVSAKRIRLTISPFRSTATMRGSTPICSSNASSEAALDFALLAVHLELDHQTPSLSASQSEAVGSAPHRLHDAPLRGRRDHPLERKPRLIQ